MLPPAHRMRRSADFAAAVRGGRRTARPTLVLHVRSRPSSAGSTAGSTGGSTGGQQPPVPRPDPLPPVRVGLVVSRRVGNAVTRNRVARRLRALCRERLDRWGPGDLVVVRALPAAGSASSTDLALDLDRAISRLSGSAA